MIHCHLSRQLHSVLVVKLATKKMLVSNLVTLKCHWERAMSRLLQVQRTRNEIFIIIHVISSFANKFCQSVPKIYYLQEMIMQIRSCCETLSQRYFTLQSDYDKLTNRLRRRKTLFTKSESYLLNLEHSLSDLFSSLSLVLFVRD